MESISPILENVLSSLTGEYEKKLFDKDQEVKSLQVWDTELMTALCFVETPCISDAAGI